jgi:hypothetical protein
MHLPTRYRKDKVFQLKAELLEELEWLESGL